MGQAVQIFDFEYNLHGTIKVPKFSRLIAEIIKSTCRS
jgi:hypothetical protein